MALTRQQIGQRLREVRERIGFTQAQVAKHVKMHRPTISEIEAGRRAVTGEELYLFSTLYATPISELLVGDPRPGIDAAVEMLYRGHEPKSPETKTAIKRFTERCRAEGELEELLGLPPRPDTRPAYEVKAPGSKPDAIRQGHWLAAQERRRLELGVEPVRGLFAMFIPLG